MPSTAPNGAKLWDVMLYDKGIHIGAQGYTLEMWTALYSNTVPYLSTLIICHEP